jgi:hypothetical protein
MVVTSCLAVLAELARLLRRRAGPAVIEPPHQSLPDLADAALRPGTKTRLVARAVSLRAF